ncbi:MAG: starch-binding protein [Prevotella sp.]|nr:starch-binding protein [Prevotella sp.]
MKGKIFTLLTAMIMLVCQNVKAVDGWPANYGGVMLQAFYWDSYSDTKWTNLTKNAQDLAGSFDLIWIPQSGNTGGKSMGYDDKYWFPGGIHYTSAFGNETQLRTLISTLKGLGVKTIGDVVINHRNTESGWFGFPSETYNGVTYSMSSTDVCSDDDGGAAATQAAKEGKQLGNKDTGEGWDGFRDLDHTSANVQKCVKAYLKMLLNDLGYAGFRYDMVKGYSGGYTSMYNHEVNPEFSVGEYWDGTGNIRGWIDATKWDDMPQSAAFDFQFKYVVGNACNNGDYGGLMGNNGDNWGVVNWPLISNMYAEGGYRRWAVTFVENHDTEVRPDGSSNGPLLKDTLAANAFMLAMPGTPCVFYKHWLAYKSQIAHMIQIRKKAGVHNMSTYSVLKNEQSVCAVEIQGTKSKLVAVIGTGDYTPDLNQYALVASGYHYKYYLEKKFDEVMISLASGTYTGPQKATLSLLSSDASAKIVYTTNGNAPTASSNPTTGTTITIPIGTTTLKAGLLKNGTVSGIIERTYTIKEQEIPSFCTRAAGETCAFFEAPSSWGNVNCWRWDKNYNYTGGNWPGVACTNVGTTGGKKVWKWTYKESQRISQTANNAGIIFNDGESQTANLDFYDGGYYNSDGVLVGVVADPAGIESVQVSGLKVNDYVYTLDGRRVSDGNALTKGVYIKGGKKYIVK